MRDFVIYHRHADKGDPPLTPSLTEMETFEMIAYLYYRYDLTPEDIEIRKIMM
jgi:hypothetical protein